MVGEDVVVEVLVVEEDVLLSGSRTIPARTPTTSPALLVTFVIRNCGTKDWLTGREDGLIGLSEKDTAGCSSLMVVLFNGSRTSWGRSPMI